MTCKNCPYYTVEIECGNRVVSLSLQGAEPRIPGRVLQGKARKEED